MGDSQQQKRMGTPTRRELLDQLSRTVLDVVQTFAGIPDPQGMVNEGWTAGDLLAHITFWHESFARNVADLAAGVTPRPLKGRLMDLNQGGVDALRQESTPAVMQRLQAAQQIIEANIESPLVGMIPYRVGSRPYSPQEHLEIVNDHIRRHLGEIQKATRRDIS